MPSDALDQIALKQFIDDIGPAVGELIGHFITDIRGKITALSALPDEPDITTLAIHAHSLKGLSRTCGLNAISDLAYDLEKACRNGTREQAMTYFAEISSTIEPTVEALDLFIMEHSANQDS